MLGYYWCLSTAVARVIPLIGTELHPVYSLRMFVYNPENNPSEITSDNSSMALGLGKQPHRKKKHPCRQCGSWILLHLPCSSVCGWARSKKGWAPLGRWAHCSHMKLAGQMEGSGSYCSWPKKGTSLLAAN